MKRNLLGTLFILMSVLFLFNSCSKYDDGPYISLYSREKRVQGRWYFIKVKYNDLDSTQIYRYDPTQLIEFFHNPDKKAVWNAYTWNIYSGSTSTVGYGMWRLNEENDSLLMATTIRRFPDDVVSFDTLFYNWKIIRLAYTEMTLERMYDDTTRITWELYKPVY